MTVPHVIETGVNRFDRGGAPAAEYAAMNVFESYNQIL
jgi:hypothetical protein